MLWLLPCTCPSLKWLLYFKAMSILLVLEQHPLVFVGFSLLLGLVVGSFLNVVILRMPPLMEYHWKKDYAEFTETEFTEQKPPGIALARSHCPQCKNQLSAWHNIPVVSFLILQGKCAFCKKSISIRYPAIELITGILTALMAYMYGVEWQFVAAVILLWFLVVITFIDIDTYLIPDQLSLTLLWLGLLFSLFDFSVPTTTAVIGAIVGYMSLWLVFHIFKIVTGKDGMGYGDFKLLAAGGAWLGYESLIMVLFMASISGLLIALVQFVMKKGQVKIPFGPYLSMGIMISYLVGDRLLDMVLIP